MIIVQALYCLVLKATHLVMNIILLLLPGKYKFLKVTLIVNVGSGFEFKLPGSKILTTTLC